MVQQDSLPPGTMLADEYWIERLLGSGGFANTYLARDTTLERSVAVKEYFPRDFAVRGESNSVCARSRQQHKDYLWGLDRFSREAKIISKLKHPNVVRVYRVFNANNTAYIVLEFVDGADLEVTLANRRTRPTQTELDCWATGLLGALEAVHAEKILHRDVKPANIFIRRSDGTPILIDFGASKFAFGEASGTTAAIVSRGYSPQEAYAADAKLQGPWTDIYSFSATLYYALTGQTPPEATERVLADQLVPVSNLGLKGYRDSFLAAIDWGLRIQPQQRPHSVAQWRQALMHGHISPAAPIVVRPAQPPLRSSGGWGIANLFGGGPKPRQQRPAPQPARAATPQPGAPPVARQSAPSALAPRQSPSPAPPSPSPPPLPLPQRTGSALVHPPVPAPAGRPSPSPAAPQRTPLAPQHAAPLTGLADPTHPTGRTRPPQPAPPPQAAPRQAGAPAASQRVSPTPPAASAAGSQTAPSLRPSGPPPIPGTRAPTAPPQERSSPHAGAASLASMKVGAAPAPAMKEGAASMRVQGAAVAPQSERAAASRQPAQLPSPPQATRPRWPVVVLLMGAAAASLAMIYLMLPETEVAPTGPGTQAVPRSSYDGGFRSTYRGSEPSRPAAPVTTSPSESDSAPAPRSTTTYRRSRDDDDDTPSRPAPRRSEPSRSYGEAPRSSPSSSSYSGSSSSSSSSGKPPPINLPQ